MDLSRFSRCVGAFAGAALIFSASASATANHISGPTSKGSYVATVLVPTKAYTLPGGHTVISALSTRALFYGGPNSLMVLGEATVKGQQYLDVRLPQRPDL